MTVSGPYRRPDGVDDLRAAVGLAEEAGAAGLQRFRAHLRLVVGGDEDQGGMSRLRVPRALHLDSRHAVQLDVDEQTAEAASVAVAKERFGGMERSRLEACEPQQARERAAHARVVVDDGDRDGHAGHCAAAPCARTTARWGRVRLDQARVAGERGELRHGAHPDLAGYRGAVQLDGALVDAKVGGDLLVHAAAQHVAQHLELALREPGKALAHLALLPVGRESALHGCGQLLARRALLEEIDSAASHGAHRAGNVGRSGEEDHPQAQAAPCKLALQLETIHPRHVEIHHHAAARLAGELREQFSARGVARHLVASRGEQARQRARIRAIVVDHADDRLAHPPAAATGSVKRKVAPESRLFCAHSRPPCASVMVRETARPMPRPFALVVTKGSNTRGRMAGAMPWPESATATSIVRSSARRAAIATRRRLDSETASMPFTSRLSSTWDSCTRSPATGGRSSGTARSSVTRRAAASVCTSASTSRASGCSGTSCSSMLLRFSSARMRSMIAPARWSSLRMSLMIARSSARSGALCSSMSCAASALRSIAPSGWFSSCASDPDRSLHVLTRAIWARSSRRRRASCSMPAERTMSRHSS